MQYAWKQLSLCCHWGRKAGIHLFLFCGFLVLLCWPILSIAESMGPYWSVVVYLFGIWVVMIAVVFFVAISCLKYDPNPPKTTQGPTDEC